MALTAAEWFAGKDVTHLVSSPLERAQQTAGPIAETLGLPIGNVLVDTADTDTGPHCMGTFASRGTHRVGNAVIMAAAEARAVMLEVAAEELEVDAGDLETDGTGFIRLKKREKAERLAQALRDLTTAIKLATGDAEEGRPGPGDKP